MQKVYDPFPPESAPISCDADRENSLPFANVFVPAAVQAAAVAPLQRSRPWLKFHNTDVICFSKVYGR